MPLFSIPRRLVLTVASATLLVSAQQAFAQAGANVPPVPPSGSCEDCQRYSGTLTQREGQCKANGKCIWFPTGAESGYCDKDPVSCTIRVFNFGTPPNVPPVPPPAPASPSGSFAGACCVPEAAKANGGYCALNTTDASYDLGRFMQNSISCVDSDPDDGINECDCVDNPDHCLLNFTDASRTDQGQIDDCKAAGGIHYDQTKWGVCSDECGALLGLYYCAHDDAAQYQCVTFPEYQNASGFLSLVSHYGFATRQACAPTCVPPPDLATTIGCACGEYTDEFGVTQAWNTCTVTVTNNGKGPAMMESLEVALGLDIGTDQYEAGVASVSNGTSAVQFSAVESDGLDSTSITYPDGDDPVEILPGESLTAPLWVRIPSGSLGQGSFMTAWAVDPHEPSDLTADNSAGEKFRQVGDACQALTVVPQCDPDRPAEEGSLMQYQISVQLPPFYEGQSAMHASIELGYDIDAALLGQGNPLDVMLHVTPDNISCVAVGNSVNNTTVECDLKAADSPYPSAPLTFSFPVGVKPTVELGTDIGANLLAQVSVDGGTLQPTNVVSVIHQDCGKCDLCARVNMNPANAANRGPTAKDMCESWVDEYIPPNQYCEFVTLPSGEQCKMNTDIDAGICPAWFGCCARKPYDITQPPDVQQYMGQFFAGGYISGGAANDGQEDTIWSPTIYSSPMDEVRACLNGTLPDGYGFIAAGVNQVPVFSKKFASRPTPAQLNAFKDLCERPYPVKSIGGGSSKSKGSGSSESSQSSDSSDSSQSSTPSDADVDYICTNALYRSQTTQALQEIQYCGVYGADTPNGLPETGPPPQSLKEFSVFFSRAYDQYRPDDAAYDASRNRLSCPIICERQQDIGLCCSATGCHDFIHSDECNNGLNGMFLPFSDQDREICEEYSGPGGACDF